MAGTPLAADARGRAKQARRKSNRSNVRGGSDSSVALQTAGHVRAGNLSAASKNKCIDGTQFNSPASFYTINITNYFAAPDATTTPPQPGGAATSPEALGPEDVHENCIDRPPQVPPKVVDWDNRAIQHPANQDQCGCIRILCPEHVTLTNHEYEPPNQTKIT